MMFQTWGGVLFVPWYQVPVAIFWASCLWSQVLRKLKRCLNPDLNRVSRMSRILEGRNIWTCQRVYIYIPICSFASIQIHIPFTYLYILYIYVYYYLHINTQSHPRSLFFFSVWEICESLSFWGFAGFAIFWLSGKRQTPFVKKWSNPWRCDTSRMWKKKLWKSAISRDRL